MEEMGGDHVNPLVDGALLIFCRSRLYGVLCVVLFVIILTVVAFRCHFCACKIFTVSTVESLSQIFLKSLFFPLFLPSQSLFMLCCLFIYGTERMVQWNNVILFFFNINFGIRYFYFFCTFNTMEWLLYTVDYVCIMIFCRRYLYF